MLFEPHCFRRDRSSSVRWARSWSFWVDARELLGIAGRRPDISGITAERCESQKRFAIVRMLGQVPLQDFHRFIDPAGRVQRDSVDISVARPVGFELGRRAEFGERVIWPLLSGEGQPERVVQAGIFR
jgi:hypothetical protein